MEIDKELQEIIDKAFLSSERCALKKMEIAWKKEEFTKRIIAYLEKKLGNGRPAES